MTRVDEQAKRPTRYEWTSRNCLRPLGEAEARKSRDSCHMWHLRSCPTQRRLSQSVMTSLRCNFEAMRHASLSASYARIAAARPA